jgi:LuxR family maltose regulon positive regulatory protein
METPLLQTKLYIPQPQTNHIPRPRLVALMNEGAGRKLTLVSAPAGFGKSSLLSQWASQSDRSISWLSLDDDDNEIARFLSYFIVALQKINKEMGIEPLAALQSSQNPQINTILTALVNEISAIEENFSLILDDYHIIKSPNVHEALNFVLDHSPPHMHLIISSRADPFLPISRFRASGELMELRMENLRFSPEEATKYLNQVRQLDLTEEDVLALDSRTEGWISGIHLAALSMQGHEAPSQFISDFAGDDRYIIDYLVDEVLAKRPSGTKDFLLKTSIFGRMNAQLCDAVTGRSDGKATLSALDQANLFIVPLDNRRHWYRYHRLFIDVLHQRLEEAFTRHEIATLHQLASQWFGENGFIFEAIEHSLAADDYESAVRLIEQSVEKIFATGQLVALTKLWDQFSQEYLLTHPKICMIFSWAWLATGYLQEADDCLRIVERSYGANLRDLSPEGDADVDPSTEAFGAFVEVAVIQSQLFLHRGNIAQALELSQLALSLLEDEEATYLYTPPSESRTVAYFNLGLGHELIGELATARTALKNALKLARQVGNFHIVAVASGHLAKIHRINGDLLSAIQVCEQGIKVLQELAGRTPMSGVLLSEWGLIAYEQNNLEAARDLFLEAISLGKLWGLWEALVPGYFGLACIKYAHGEIDGAFQALDELETLGKDNPESVMPVVKATRARFWALEGNLDFALDWVNPSGLDVDHEIRYALEDEYIILARVLIAAKQLDEADRLIDRLQSTAESGKRNGRLIELLTLKAMSLEAQNSSNAALFTISRALKLAEPNGYVRIFLDEGEPMLELLRGALAQGIESAYVSKLLVEFEDKDVRPEGEAVTPAADLRRLALVESLSDRELEVLRLLDTELSGPEIARELVIALSTLRTHTQSIYSKLNVNNRRAAIRRAEEMNLL